MIIGGSDGRIPDSFFAEGATLPAWRAAKALMDCPKNTASINNDYLIFPNH